MYIGFMYQRSMNPTLPMTSDFPIFFSLKKYRVDGVFCYTKHALHFDLDLIMELTRH
jgi:hypothetical protein